MGSGTSTHPPTPPLSSSTHTMLSHPPTRVAALADSNSAQHTSPTASPLETTQCQPREWPNTSEDTWNTTTHTERSVCFVCVPFFHLARTPSPTYHPRNRSCSVCDELYPTIYDQDFLIQTETLTEGASFIRIFEFITHHPTPLLASGLLALVQNNGRSPLGCIEG
ncbi:hypothetical protein JAAARDRAFT_192385 [Jaapia argillacea MUCL 33604]|uniref:Uncharacterized protein n=1 Tax=Jaapia argillacea MUCL 33604 TaxID=933084 RepID=A0A067Q1E6_9AGAM|nr:hypothetical protein JAAARDRAFT_192385 [Jaapia argillacea MUCL 33604]